MVTHQAGRPASRPLAAAAHAPSMEGVASARGVQRPKTLEYQIYPPSSPIIWYSSNWNGLRCGGEKKWTGGVWRIHVAKWKEEKKVEKEEMGSPFLVWLTLPFLGRNSESDAGKDELCCQFWSAGQRIYWDEWISWNYIYICSQRSKENWWTYWNQWSLGDKWVGSV